MAATQSAWAMVTPMLLFSSFCLLTGDLLFGYDTESFGGILANPGFIRQFGKYNEESRTYAFDSLHTSLLSSLAFIGKFIGCFSAGPLIEKFGHRIVFFGLSVVSLIGIVLEIAAADTGVLTGRFAQFVVGRVIVYISVGLVEVTVTTYQSEIVPASFRGFVVVSLQLFLNAGSLLASGVNKAFSLDTSATGWKVVTGIQFIFPVAIVACTFIIPSSPRWLLSKDREADAINALSHLRPKTHAEHGDCEAEIIAIRESLRQDVHKAPWLALVRGTHLRRTILVIATGQAFVSTYQTVFYSNNGYKAQAFTYPIINGVLGMLAVLPAMYLVDKLGRQYTLLLSYTLQAFFMYLLAGLGQISNKTSSESNMIVAAFMLFSFFYNMGGASIPYLLGSEIPNAALREKTQSLGTAWNVVWAFITNFILPYMISSLHFGVGWVFGSISVVAFVFTFFFLPETKGRALEDIDAVFEVGFSPFRSAAATSSAIERRVGLTGARMNGSGDKIETLPEVKHV
ncbi:hypothetical protein PFICI_03117 [Pestalotiopsis fici W106-1]|uniref:Major facilitator superfamily (MFS) profile domain-containing protein n=1 Tax=Pestalotiopsis fici (strain W106-1 / CGMCC3.15140) TaxID=1229662 RepID=W3XI27_PESFW|nr:uncharacterized protein PFICI_03117 [Pestalotiopsis fici W106-1]ETS85092.1 hypothetical protein PFICI_03117 [Pestalotiopsis fici W106-1]